MELNKKNIDAKLTLLAEQGVLINLNLTQKEFGFEFSPKFCLAYLNSKEKDIDDKIISVVRDYFPDLAMEKEEFLENVLFIVSLLEWVD